MISILNRFRKENSYICIYADETDSRKFIYGKIIGVDMNDVAISMVSPEGDYDGMLIKKVDDIIRIDQSTNYKRKMDQLMKIKNYKEKKYSLLGDNIIKWGLTLAKEKGVIVSVELDHSGIDDVIGFVENINDEEICEITLINEYGNQDGKSYFSLKDISQICIDSTDEQLLLALYRDQG